MKIDFIATSLKGGGAERVMVLLANHFAEKGHKIGIITLNEVEAYEVHDAIRRTRLHKSWIKNHSIRSLNSLIGHYGTKKNRPDLVISFLPKVNFFSNLTCKLYNIKIIVSEHYNHLHTDNFIEQFSWNYILRIGKLTMYPILRTKLKSNGIKSLEKYNINKIGAHWESLFLTV